MSTAEDCDHILKMHTLCIH